MADPASVREDPPADDEDLDPERRVVERLRAIVPEGTAVLHHIRWLRREHGYEREGEADVVVADPERGLLVVEVKGGAVRRERDGRWFAGRRPLDRPPFEQAADSRHALVAYLTALPDWPSDLKPIAGHAVAFPDAELDTVAAGTRQLLGPDVDIDLIADQSAFLDTDDARVELRGFLDRAFERWSGGADTRPPGRQGVDLLLATLTTPVVIRSQLRNEIAGKEPEVVRLTENQFSTLRTLQGRRRAAIVGSAGTGKTMLAEEQARRLVREGHRTLLVCFNSALAARLGRDAAGDLLDVRTYHQLCEDLGREAGVLPPRPEPVPQAWWDETLPQALDAAIERLGPRYSAIVVDEGQDFEPTWLLSLDELLIDGREDVLYVFHDPEQAIFREDAVDQLGLRELILAWNCRNPKPIHDVLERLTSGRLGTLPAREEGREPEFVEAEGDETVELALRKVLHHLRSEELVAPWEIAVLTGRSLEKSAVWARPGRRYGNEVLGNAAVDDAGRHLGTAAHLVPKLPDDVILCDSIRRFKGLERPVIVLVELEPGDDLARFRRLLYVGASRARHHLVVIGSPAVLDLMR